MRKHDASVDPVVRAQQRRAVRTAWVMAGIAFAVYAAFLLSGVLGK